jgi:LysR family transcriptional regulator, glycine cleavage system transcriptional activator
MRSSNENEPDDPGLSWSQIRAFEACLRVSSFSGAALILNVSASAVRYQIGLMETRVGAVMFERTGGRLALTKIGRDFARQIEAPYRALLRACANAKQAAHNAPITLTAPPLFARQFLLDSKFLNWCDANAIRLDIADSRRDLFGAELIAAIRVAASDDPDLVLKPLLKVELCLASAPPIAQHALPHDSDWWQQQTLLSPSASENEWNAVWQSLDLSPRPKPRVVAYRSYSAAIEAACAGKGIILAPLPFAQQELVSGRLSDISDARFAASAGFSLVMRNALAASARGRALTHKLLGLCAAAKGSWPLH